MKKKYGINNIKELFLALLPAQIFSFVVSSLSGIVNGLLIGKFLSSLDMVALGFAVPVTQILTVCATVVSSGARILCGRYIGRGESEKVNETFTTSIYTLLAIGIAITLIGEFGADVIARIIASEEAVYKTALYIRGLSIGAIPTIITPCLMVFLQMKNENNYALLSTLVLAVLNFGLAYGAIKLLSADIFVIGVATSLSQLLTLLFLCVRFITVKTLPRFCKCKNKLYKDILIIGTPSAMATFLYALRNSILNIFAADLHSIDAVNALSILTSSCGPLDAVNVGVGQTVLMLASIYIGEKDKDSLSSLFKIGVRIGVLLGFIKIAAIYLFSGNLADLYGASANVKVLTIDLYRAYSLSMPLNMIMSSLLNIYQSFGKIKYCNILLLITALIYPVAFAYLLFGAIGINSIWHCYWTSEIFILLVMYAYISYKKKKLVTNIDDLLAIGDDLEVGSHITITVNSIEEIENVSKMIQDYCIKENIDKQRSYIAGLVCDEMATNIVEHGFTKSKKRNKFIDIYCDVDNDTVNIRIKDNAVSFDPHIKLQNNDDVTTNIGIKMVSKLAKKMNYQNTFGLNVLSIEL